MRLFLPLAISVALTLGSGLSPAATADEMKASANDGAEYFSGVIIYASDIERSIKFYTDIMGLKVAGRVAPQGKLAEVLLSKSGKLFGGADLILQPTDGLPERSAPSRLKFGTIVFMTASNKPLADRLRAAGYEATDRDPAHLMTKDPDGHQIMIYQFDEHLKAAQK